MASPASAQAQSYDDMDDSAEIVTCSTNTLGGENGPALCQALEYVQQLIFPAFQKADQEAQKSRKEYQQISSRAVWFGAAAVIVGIVQFAVPEPVGSLQVSLDLFEAAAAGVCLFFIWKGVHGEPKEKWLVARYQAEHLRLLKFKTLTGPDLWCDESDKSDGCDPKRLTPVWQNVDDKVFELMALDYEQVKERAGQGIYPDLVQLRYPPSCYPALAELIRYYCDKRLRTQMNYLATKSKDEKKQGSVWQLLTRNLFFASFGFVLVHLLLSFIGIFTTLELLPLEKASLVIAAIPPAAVAGIRSFRASREFERNALRHRATLDSLEKLSDKMVETNARAEHSGMDEKAKGEILGRQLEIVRFCELVLEYDTCEFMRLLSEVEWY